MKKITQNLLLAGMFIVGLSLLLYPTISNWWNSSHQSKAVSSYVEVVETIDKNKYEEQWKAAEEYNKKLALSPQQNVFLSKADEAEYKSLLKVQDTDVMGYIEIPIIDCVLPMYHGTDEEQLHAGVGHLEWTSLPVGGESTHAVVSGHRGVPSAKLLSNLDKVVEGDYFVLHVLNEMLTYQVDQILIVEPDDVDDLYIQKGEDLCTLVTCTPYGVNSHRLLVRGHRVDNGAVESLKIASDATQIDPTIVAVFVGIIVLGIILIGMSISSKISYSKDKSKKGGS